MPEKKFATFNIEDIMKIAKVAELGRRWAAMAVGITTEELDWYRDTCAAYGIDPTVLLYTFQVERAEMYAAQDSPTAVQGVQPS